MASPIKNIFDYYLIPYNKNRFFINQGSKYFKSQRKYTKNFNKISLEKTFLIMMHSGEVIKMKIIFNKGKKFLQLIKYHKVKKQKIN